MSKHEPTQVELDKKGWTGICLCGEPVRYTGTIRGGEWEHVDGR